MALECIGLALLGGFLRGLFDGDPGRGRGGGGGGGGGGLSAV